jgi:hypothetical protein
MGGLENLMDSLSSSATEAEVNNTKNNKMMGTKGLDLSKQNTNSADPATTQQAAQVETKPSHAPTSTTSTIVGSGAHTFGGAMTGASGSGAHTFGGAMTGASGSGKTNMGSILSTGAAITGAKVTATATDKDAQEKQGLQTEMFEAKNEAKTMLESIIQINEELSVLIP